MDVEPSAESLTKTAPLASIGAMRDALVGAHPQQVMLCDELALEGRQKCSTVSGRPSGRSAANRYA
jgi:hypothetical protein